MKERDLAATRLTTGLRSVVDSRVRRAVGAQLSGVGVQLAVQTLSVPVFLASFGTSRFGDWLALTALPTYLAFSDFGLVSATGTELLHLRSGGRLKEAVHLWSSTWCAASGVFLFLCVAIAIGFRSIDLVAVLHLRDVTNQESEEVVIAMLLYVFCNLQMSVIETGYRVADRYAEGILLQNLQRILVWAGGAVTALFTHDLPATALAFAVGQFCIAACYYARLRFQADSDLKLTLIKPDWHRLRALVAPSAGSLSIPLGNAASAQGMTLVVNRILGPSAVVQLTVVRTIANVQRQINLALNQGLLPSLADALVQRDTKRLRRLRRLATYGPLILNLVISLFVIASFSWILRVWTGGRTSVGLAFVVWSLLTVLADSPWQGYFYLVTAANRHFRLGVLFLLSSLTAVLLSYLGLRSIGLAAVPISLLLVDAVVGPAAFVYGRRILQGLDD